MVFLNAGLHALLHMAVLFCFNESWKAVHSGIFSYTKIWISLWMSVTWLIFFCLFTQWSNYTPGLFRHKKWRHLLFICVNDMLMIFFTPWLCSEWNSSILFAAQYTRYTSCTFLNNKYLKNELCNKHFK